MPEGLKQHRISKLEDEIREADENIRFLKAEDIHYVHIPTRLWIEPLYDKDPVLARRVINRFFKERQTVDVRELAQHLKAEGVITDKDIDIRNIIAAYAQKSGHLLALSNIINAAAKEGLISDSSKNPDWPRFSPRWSPEMKGKTVHPTFYNFLDEFTRRGQHVRLGRMLSYFKITQFDNPLLLPTYDVMQGMWLGSMRAIKTPLHMWKAFKSMKDKDEAYIKLMENGLSSQPYTPPFDEFMRNVEMAKASDSFVRYTIAYLKSNYKIPTDLIYKPLWHIAWGGDRFIRLISAHYLLDKGHTYREAAQIAAKYHSDYASVPHGLRRTLNKIFFTPIFPITMTKLQTEMIVKTGKVLTDAVRLKKPKAKDTAMAGGLVALLGLAVLQDVIMKQLGYDRDTFGYRYTKEVVDDDGNTKELVVVTPNPSNVMLRYAKSFWNWPNTPEQWGRYTLRLSWRLHPVWRLVVRLGANLHDDGKTPIYNPFDDPARIAWDITKFSSGQLIHIIRRIDELLEMEPDKRAAIEALQDDVGSFTSTFIRITSQVYLRGTKDKRKRAKAIQLMEEFATFSAKKPLTLDKMERAMRRFERALRSIMDTE